MYSVIGVGLGAGEDEAGGGQGAGGEVAEDHGDREGAAGDAVEHRDGARTVLQCFGGSVG